MTPNVAKKSIPAKCGDAGAPEIEITPEMIEAGAPYLFAFHREGRSEDEVLADIFRAMTFAAKKSRETPSH